MTALASSARPFKCPVCERIVERKSRQQSFCSTRCRMKAFRKKNPATPGCSGSVTKPPKLDKENNVLQWVKSGSSLSGKSPINLLGGGSWKWGGALRVDSKTLAKIRWCEVGGELLMPPEDGA